MTGEDYVINLAISFSSLEGIKGALIPCTKSRDSSNVMMGLKCRPLSRITTQAQDLNVGAHVPYPTVNSIN